MVEFIGMFRASGRREAGFNLDPDYARRFAAVLEHAGFDWTLVPYDSSAPDANQVAAAVLAETERLKVFVAHRSGVVFPTHASRLFATLDNLYGGRAAMHLISGGNDAEQRREGDYLTKDERYERAGEYLRILRRAWQDRAPFTHRGRYYEFEDFHSDVLPIRGDLTVSVGGSSHAAYQLGAAQADVFALWGEPLANTAEQIDSITALASAAGRPRPKIWIGFRPILAPTDAEAWSRAEDIAARIRPQDRTRPQNVGSQRLLDVASRGERYDRALWTALAPITNGAGSSTALVGSPETVAEALLDYVELGCDFLALRGHDALEDAIQFGHHLIPLVRQELARRNPPTDQ